MKAYPFDRFVLATAVVGLAVALTLSTQVAAYEGEIHHKVVPSEKIVFQPGPATLPEGVEFAVLHGNPAEKGPFVMRLRFPAGYVIPPHMHPEEEHVTVISGGLGVGAGESYDESAAPLLAPGSFVRIPVGMAHFARTEEESVVQINALGPFGITYVNPEDDPRIN